LITAACKKVPENLLGQLAMNGLLLAPIGENIQSLVLLKKTSDGIIEIKNQKGYVFVPFV
jgi:protein-L-isoaspartate O-methyltransferase